MRRSNEVRVDKSWLVKRAQTLINSHQNLNQFKVDESDEGAWELAVKRQRELQPSSTLILVWSGFNSNEKLIYLKLLTTVEKLGA